MSEQTALLCDDFYYHATQECEHCPTLEGVTHPVSKLHDWPHATQCGHCFGGEHDE